MQYAWIELQDFVVPTPAPSVSSHDALVLSKSIFVMVLCFCNLMRIIKDRTTCAVLHVVTANFAGF
jgi:hypothetical protein